MDLQLLVFDSRRGNTEGREDDKVLAGFPSGLPLVQQSGLAGLLQGLLLFTANFTAPQRPRWDVAETDSGTWVLHEAEPHIWFAALAPRAWLPRHASEHNLRSLLAQMHLLVTVLCGSVQDMLDQDPSGGLAREGLQTVASLAGEQLGSHHSWLHRELRNPLMDAAMPPALQLAPATAAAVQSLSNQLLQATLAGRRPVAGVVLLYGPHLLWSSLAPRDTAGVFALIATGLLHASSSSSSSGSGGIMSSANGGSSAAAAAAETQRSHLRPLDGGSWQQLLSGYLVQRGSSDADMPQQGAAAVTVPLVHLQHPPPGGDQQQAAQQQAAAGGQRQPYHLLPLLEGKLLVALLLGGNTQLSSGLLASLHGLAAAPAKQLAAQIGEEVRLSKAEAAHLPGFRYLYQDAGQGVVRASPRVKVSAMSHHARMLAAAVRDSLRLLLVADDDGEGQKQAASASAADCDGAGAAGGRASGIEDSAVLEVLAKSSQDCWVAAWRPDAGCGSGGGGGRQLLAVRERRSERELAEAADVMQAFAEQHFLV